jgi:hypothetical protein
MAIKHNNKNTHRVKIETVKMHIEGMTCEL